MNEQQDSHYGGYNMDDKDIPVTALNPWHPITNSIDLKILGKLGEEINELGSAISRCIIQGVDECEPVTRKPNKEWLENEIADVKAGILLTEERFALDKERITARAKAKVKALRQWHYMA